jgi:hypothetical protein
LKAVLLKSIRFSWFKTQAEWKNDLAFQKKNFKGCASYGAQSPIFKAFHVPEI